MRSPRAIDLEITHICNLRCDYCSFFSSASDVRNDLPTVQWLKFFDELNCCKVTHVTLSGGEPFCRSDLKELIEGIVSNRMRFNILSNGTLITEEMAAFIAATGRCDGIQVSIDGSTPISHDAYRGEGSFYKAIKGIRILQKYEIPVQVRLTIHQKNVRDLENIAKLLLEDLALPGFSTNAASYMGLCRQNADRLQLNNEEQMIAMESLIQLENDYEGRISASAGPLANVQSWMAMEKAFQEGHTSLPDGGRLTSCNGVFSKLAVRADGLIVPCSQISHIELARINEADLIEVWQHHEELNRLRDRQEISLDQFEYCGDCKYISNCRGGCPAIAYTHLNDDAHPDISNCYKRFLEEGGILPDTSLINTECDQTCR